MKKTQIIKVQLEEYPSNYYPISALEKALSDGWEIVTVPVVAIDNSGDYEVQVMIYTLAREVDLNELLQKSQEHVESLRKSVLKAQQLLQAAYKNVDMDNLPDDVAEFLYD